MKDVSFSDGTFIPAGTFVVANATDTQLDEANYSNPNEFNPDRFLKSKAQVNGNVHDDFDGDKYPRCVVRLPSYTSRDANINTPQDDIRYAGALENKKRERGKLE